MTYEKMTKSYPFFKNKMKTKTLMKKSETRFPPNECFGCLLKMSCPLIDDWSLYIPGSPWGMSLSTNVGIEYETALVDRRSM